MQLPHLLPILSTAIKKYLENWQTLRGIYYYLGTSNWNRDGDYGLRVNLKDANRFVYFFQRKIETFNVSCSTNYTEEGDNLDWEELYIEYSDKVHNYIYLMVRNRDVAEDLTHDTFLKVKYSLDRYRGDSRYYTWIISIARNVTFDYFRRKKLVHFTPMLPFHSPRELVTPDDILFDKESIQELYETINRLKTSYQDVIILRYIQEFSIEETASILNCSVSKVKSTTFRAVKQLKAELLKKEGD